MFNILDGAKSETSNFDLPEAPVFRPSKEEWEDPIRFLCSIREAVEPYGLCKIKPPAGWKPPFSLDKQNLVFPTRKQLIHELQDRKALAAQQEEFETKYAAFVELVGTVPTRTPELSGEEVDLFQLYNIVVEVKGGYDKLDAENGWDQVAGLLKVYEDGGNAAGALRQIYCKYLKDFEYHQRACQQANGAAVSSTRSKTRRDTACKAHGAHGYGSSTTNHKASAQEPPSKKRKKGEKQHSKAEPEFRVPDNIDSLLCEFCSGGAREEQIILCDRCDRGFHTFCLSPPLEDVPEGDWVCPVCLAADSEKFAFKPGQRCTWDEFEQVANRFKNSYWGSEDAANKVSWKEMEAAFWRIVEQGREHIEVLYGADLDSSTYGSGFPKKNGQSHDSSYAEDKWNLNNLPRQAGSFCSVLRFIDDDVSGVIVPWLYIGMMFSAFCWHVEDHLFYSANYHHYGAPKRWYSVPFNALGAFEQVFQKTVPDQFTAQPDLLFQLITTLSPRVLTQHKVPVCTLVQEQGDMIVSFPGAYHAGFNHGFNCAEAVNFVPADWFHYADAAAARYRRFRKPSVLSQEELLLKVAASNPDPFSAICVERVLHRMVRQEAELRYRCWERGIKTSAELDSVTPDSTDELECAVCHQYLHLSAVECECIPNRLVCLHDVQHLCDCPAHKSRLLYRFTVSELEAVWAKVAALAATTAPSKLLLPGYSPCKHKAAAVKQEAATVKQEAAAVKQDAAAVKQDAAAVKQEAAVVKQEAVGWCPANQQAAADMEVDVGAQQGAAEPVVPSSAAATQPSAVPATSPVVVAGAAAEDPAGCASPKAAAADAEAAGEAAAAAANSTAAAAVAVAQDMAEPMDAAEPTSDGAIPTADGANPTTHGANPTTDGANPTTDGANPTTDGANPTTDAAKPPAAGSAASPDAAEPMELQPQPPTIDYGDVVASLRRKYEAKRGTWRKRAQALLSGGNCRVGELDGLLQEVQQYLWGFGDVRDCADLRQQLLKVRAWVTEVTSAIRGKPTLEHAAQLLAVDPPPAAVHGLPKLRNAVKQAQELQDKLAALLRKGFTHAELDEAEAQAKAAGKLAVVVPAAQQVTARVAAMRRAAAAVEAALSSSGKQAMSADALRALHLQVSEVAADIPELQQLRSALEAVEQWQQRAHAALASRPTLEELDALVSSAKQLPATVPELPQLAGRVKAANDWRQALAATAANPAVAVKQLRELLHSGEQLSVSLPQVAQLQQQLARREWEEHIRKALHAKCTLAQATALLQDAAKVGQPDAAEVQDLRQRVELAVGWSAEADAVLGKGQAPSVEQAPPSLERVQQLLLSGQKLGVKPPQLSALQQLVNKHSSWKSMASKLLARVGTASRPTYMSVAAALKAGQEQGLQSAELLKLRSIVAEADAWAQQAHNTMQDPGSSANLAALRACQQQGASIGVDLPQLAALQQQCSCLEWNARARQLSALLNATSPPQPAPHHAPAAKPDVTPSAAAMDCDPPTAPGTTHPTPPAAVSLPSAQQQPGANGHQHGAGSAVAVARKTGTAPAQNGVAHTPATSVVPPKPELGSVKQLMQQAANMAVDKELLSSLQAALRLAEAWEARAHAWMVRQQQHSTTSPHGTSGAKQELVHLLDAAGSLPFQMPQLPQLQMALCKQDSSSCQGNGLSNGLAQLPSPGKPIGNGLASSPPKAMNGNLVVPQGGWEMQCRHILAPGDAHTPLGSQLQALCSRAAQDLQRLRDVVFLPGAAAAASTIGSAERRSRRRKAAATSAKEQEPDSVLYCLCQQPYNSSDPDMILCDNCNEWFHNKCVGLSQEAANAAATWACPLCVACGSKDGPAGLHRLPALHGAPRPGVAQLQQLLGSVPPQQHSKEQQLLRELVEAASRWQAAVHEAISAHRQLRAQELQSGVACNSKRLLSESQLRELLKQAYALALDTTAVREELLQLLRWEAWRGRAKAAWSTSNKPTWEQLDSLVQDAAACGVSDQMDLFAQEATELHVGAALWMADFRRMLPQLKAAARSRPPAPVVADLTKQASALVSSAARLGVKMEKQVQQLKECSQRYCLCEQLYDEQQPMLSCDYCENWFHYDCVGLPVPSGPADAAPEDFRCPACSKAEHITYPHLHAMPAAYRQQFYVPAAAPAAVPAGGPPVQAPAGNARQLSTHDAGVALPGSSSSSLNPPTPEGSVSLPTATLAAAAAAPSQPPPGTSSLPAIPAAALQHPSTTAQPQPLVPATANGFVNHMPLQPPITHSLPVSLPLANARPAAVAAAYAPAASRPPAVPYAVRPSYAIPCLPQPAVVSTIACPPQPGVVPNISCPPQPAVTSTIPMDVDVAAAADAAELMSSVIPNPVTPPRAGSTPAPMTAADAAA